MIGKSDPRRGPKLGKIELAIHVKLSAGGGLTTREEALAAAYPGLGSRPAAGVALLAWIQRRGRAEAATTRAIQSLERKGLVVVERNTATGRTLLRDPEVTSLPSWEELARAEEDLAAHCRRIAAAWRDLASRAAARAARIRGERSELATEAERVGDILEVDRLESGKSR